MIKGKKTRERERHGRNLTNAKEGKKTREREKLK